MIVGGIFLGIGVIIAAIFIFVSSSSNKLVCKSSLGNITLMYNDKALTGYTTSGSITYDYDTATAYVEKNGIEAYMVQFNMWFATNTDGKSIEK